MKKIKILLLILILAGTMLPKTSADAAARPLPAVKGKMVYHTYSSYDREDSRIYVYDFQTCKLRCISKELRGVRNAMNGSFGKSSSELVFMGITGKGNKEEWDILYYNLKTKKLVNLTKNSRCSNEDPKFSPDGRKIVWKRGKWDGRRKKMIYNIYEMNIKSRKIRRLTNDVQEDSMPVYSTDGKAVYYAGGGGKNSQIYAVSVKKPGKVRKIYGAKNICSYYPKAVNSRTLYFSRWRSAKKQVDGIMSYDLKTRKLRSLPVNSSRYDSSDACPVSSRYLIYSSTRPGGRGGYDLYIKDMWNGWVYSMDRFHKGINDRHEQLGADYAVR